MLSYDRKGSKEYANLTISDEDPAIALLSITSIAEAMEEFNTVRVKHLPLPSSSSLPTPGTSTGGGHSAKHGLGRLWILIGILLALGLISGAFASRWFVRRRRILGRAAAINANSGHSDAKEPPAGIPIALVSIGTASDRWSKYSTGKPFSADDIDEETFRSKRWSAWHKHMSATFLPSSTGTRAGDATNPTSDFGELTQIGPDEFGDDRLPRDDFGAATTGTRISRTGQPHSQGPGVPDCVQPVTLVTDLSLLTNIPTLEEITPEALSSSRYPTFNRHPLSPSLPRRPNSLSRNLPSIYEVHTTSGSNPTDHSGPGSRSMLTEEPQEVLHRRNINPDGVLISPLHPTLSTTLLS